MDTQEMIEQFCDTLKQTLISKSVAYGNAFERPPILLPDADCIDIIYTRMSDKIARIISLRKSGIEPSESLDDTLLDLAGYCILALILREKQDNNNG